MKTTTRILVASAALALGACSFEVTNPGPVPDDVLDANGAYNAMVLGVRYNLSRATSIIAYYGAVAAKEYSTAGRVIGTKLPSVLGQLSVDDVSANNWNWAQAARWQAEDGIARLREVLGAGFATHKTAGQLLMYGALANRVLGENFCEAVIDGGAKQANTVYFTRGEALATEAIAVAGAAGDAPTRTAAYAIRAELRLDKGDFAGAGADAAVANVPTNFVLSAPFDEGAQNIIVQSNDAAVGGSFRATSVWRTYFESYYRTSGDQRVWWDSVPNPATGKATNGEITSVTWYYQRKYVPTGTTTDRGQPIRLVSGREMRLIEAELALRAGDFGTAATIINGIRVVSPPLAVRAGSPPLTGYTVTTLQEGWNALRRERSIELWLEGRTMGDLRRWIADNTYQTYFTGTFNGADSDVANRVRLCLPITRGERQTNANLSLTPDDPVSPIYNGLNAPW